MERPPFPRIVTRSNMNNAGSYAKCSRRNIPSSAQPRSTHWRRLHEAITHEVGAVLMRLAYAYRVS